MLGHNYQQNENPVEPRSEGNEGGEDSSYSGSYSFSYPGTQAPGTSDRNVRRKTTYRRPPVRILPSMRELITSNKTLSMSNKPDDHVGPPIDSEKSVCTSSERDESNLQYDDTSPLEPMPDTDTFPCGTVRPTLLSTPMQPPVEPDSRSVHKENKIIPLLENMEHLSHGLDWLMKSAHKNRQNTRRQEHQTCNNKVIEQSIKLEQQNRNYYETPSKGLSFQSNYMTPRNKECLGILEDIKKSTSHTIKSSTDLTQDKQPSLGCKKLFQPCTNEIGVAASLCPDTKAPNSVPKTTVPQYLLEIVEPIQNHAVIMTPMKHESECGINRQPHHVATNGKPILRDVINNKVDEVHARTPSVKMQLPSYSDPRMFHQTRGLNENKENEMNHVHQDRVAAENHFNLEPLNLNVKDTNGLQFPTPVKSNVLHSNNGSDLKVLKPSIGADSILPVEALSTSTAFSSKVTSQQFNNIETMPPVVKIQIQPPTVVGVLHPKPVVPVPQPSLQSLEMPPPPSKLDPPLKKTLPPTGSHASRPVPSDDKSGQPTTDQDLDNVMFLLPMAKSASNEVIRVKQQTYTVLSQLGRGGSSVVYQVINNKTQAQVAIKRVNLAGVDQVSAQGYLNEIQVLRKLQKCESVIRLFDYEYVKSMQTLLVVMEKGDTDFSSLLKDINKTKKISVLMIAYYWSEMVNAVKSIHENGIIHSDLKPANFLLVAGRLKLIDFGIASSLNVDMTSVVKSSIIGTFNYMSPEAVAAGMGQPEQGGSKITFKSDIWSLGCILYNLVYGRTPFAEVTNGMAKLIKINDPNHVIRFPPLADYPPILVTIMKHCLSYDPRHRPTAAELLQSPYLPKLEDPFLMEKIRRVVTPDVWNKIREVSGER